MHEDKIYFIVKAIVEGRQGLKAVIFYPHTGAHRMLILFSLLSKTDRQTKKKKTDLMSFLPLLFHRKPNSM